MNSTRSILVNWSILKKYFEPRIDWSILCLIRLLQLCEAQKSWESDSCRAVEDHQPKVDIPNTVDCVVN